MHPQVAVCLLAVLMVTAACAGEYVVAPRGGDRNPGTAEKPWRTLAKAAAAAKAGDTVIFLDGDYPGVLSPERSGKEGRPIVFRAASRHKTRLTGPDGDIPSRGARYCIELIDCSHVVIDGFTVIPAEGGRRNVGRRSELL